jgi:lmo0469 protein
MAQELYILGNGFDLWQKLPTKYEDYFRERESRGFSYEKIIASFRGEHLISEDRIEIIEKNVLNLYNENSSSEINKNLFYYYLLYKKDKEHRDWYEVESEIKPYINNITEILHNRYSMKLGQNIRKNKVDKSKVEDWYTFLVLLVHEIELEAAPNSEKRYINKPINFAMEHLNLFEKDFGNYIKNVQNKLAHSLDNILYNDKPKKIINFNYTTVIKNEINKFKNIQKYPTDENIRSIEEVINIHGDYKNPIFGIDNQNVDESMNIFTKTYRILSSDTIESFTLPSNKLLETIYFFGHSLSEADYSYFQSMFDYYSIYDSKIRLIFLYSDHDGKEKSRQENRVVKLINDYGKTLENKDKGKNLLHKLLLENRIKIYEIEKAKEILEK